MEALLMLATGVALLEIHTIWMFKRGLIARSDLYSCLVVESLCVFGLVSCYVKFG